MKTILLVGCGNIGFRHLQAITAMPTPAHVIIVEPDAAAHGRIRALITAHQGPHRFDLRSSLPDQGGEKPVDLVVVASSAGVRRAIVTDVLARNKVTVMVLEKVLFQSLADLDAVEDLLLESGTRAFVNCGRRYFPGYLAGRGQWAASRPLDITVAGGAFGLCSNGIHLLDLAEFLNDAPLVSVDAAGLHSGHVAAKRAGCIEVFGTMTARLANGANLSIRCDKAEVMSLRVDIMGAGLHLQINELTREIAAEGQVSAFSAKNVSECWEIYDAAVTTGHCGLTTYAASARQHRLFLTAINQHLGQQADALCPIS